MTDATDGVKAELQRYLQMGREALLWKLEGLSEYDVRRPLVPTATNLLGLVKHVASVEAGYFGSTFGRPFPQPLPWYDEGTDDNADMWATAEESREFVVDLYRAVWAHSDETIAALGLDSVGEVPWWAANPTVTLHRIMVHMIAETERHAGHADIVREMIDGEVGLLPARTNIPSGDQAWWLDHRDRVEQAARQAAGPAT